MYLVVIGWFYVAVLMALAEATNSNGSILGAIVTFFLYGLVPIALVVYLMGRPARRRRREKELAHEMTAKTEPSEASPPPSCDTPDTGGHAPGGTEASGITAVRKEL